MPTESDERMAKLEIGNQSLPRRGSCALKQISISKSELITINVLAKVTGDAFTRRVTQHLLEFSKFNKE